MLGISAQVLEEHYNRAGQVEANTTFDEVMARLRAGGETKREMRQCRRARQGSLPVDRPEWRPGYLQAEDELEQ